MPLLLLSRSVEVSETVCERRSAVITRGIVAVLPPISPSTFWLSPTIETLAHTVHKIVPVIIRHLILLYVLAIVISCRFWLQKEGLSE